MNNFFVQLFLVFLLVGCAELRIVPQPDPGATIERETRSVSRQQDALLMSVRVADVHVRPSPAEQNFASFWVEVVNQRTMPLPLSYRDFSLVAATGQQFAAQNPDELVALLKPEIAFLLPYPYVGFYYLDSAERHRATDPLRSEANFVTGRRPEALKLAALPEVDLQPQAKVAGLIYFPVELTAMSSFVISYQPAPVPGQINLPLKVGFSVEKN